MKLHYLSALLGALSLVTYSQAAVTITSSKNVAPEGGAIHDPYDPSTDLSGSGPMLTPSITDVVQGFTEGDGISTTGNDNQEGSGGVNVTTDGSVATVYNEPGGGGDEIDHAGYASVNNNDIIKYSLGGVYDITQVDIFSGWNDSGRDDFSFNLSFSTDDSTYTPIATYTKGPDDTGAITVPIINLHSISDDGGANLGTGIRFIQLEVTDADNGYAGLAEVDVFGVQQDVFGDANGDGFVNNADFIAISDNFLSVPFAIGLGGDANDDGFVDQKDFREWRNAMGEAFSAGTAIPEPSSIVLAGLFAIAGMGAQRRRS